MGVTTESRALDALYRLSEAISSAASVEEVLKRILDEAVSLIPVTKASIMKYDEQSNSLRVVASIGMPSNISRRIEVKVGEGISGKVFASSEPLLLRNIESNALPSGRKRYKSQSLISAPVTCFPLKMQGRPVGVINMTDKQDGSRFTPSDMALLNAIANQTAAYLHLCDLVETARSHQRMTEELELARKIQVKFLPKEMPFVEKLDISGSCLMAEKVGGDYFDVFTAPLSPVSAVVADVAGHNVGAALTMAALRSVIRSETTSPYLPPSAMMRRVNAVLFDDLQKSEQFVTVVFLQYNKTTSTIRYCSAGNSPPIIYRKKKDAFIDPPPDYGPPIGVEVNAAFTDERLQMQGGDVVCMFTDGVFAVRNEKGRAFDLEMLQRIVRRQAHNSAKKIIEKIHEHLNQFSDHAPLQDDISLLVIKVI